MKSYKIPLLLFLLSLIVRVIYYFTVDTIIGLDSFENVKLAKQLAASNFASGFDPYWTPLFPILVAIPSLFTDSNLAPVFIISIAAGSLGPLAIYYLIKQSYGQRVAVIAAIIAVFYPHLLRSTFELGTETIYLLFICGALFSFWKGTINNSGLDFFLTGVFLGLSYLSRPEAFGYLLFFIPLLPVSKAFSGQKVFTQSLFRNAFLLLFGFVLLAAPYILYLRSSTGTWTISAKLAHHMIGANPSNKELDSKIQSAVNSQHYIIESGILFVRAAIFILHRIHKEIVPYLFPPFLFILVGLGLFRTKWTEIRLKREIYLASFCAITILCYALNVIEVRYFYVLLPILIGWMARGIVEMEDWFTESIDLFPVNKPFAFRLPIFSILIILIINIYVLPLNNFMRSTKSAWEYSPFEQKAAGLWLKKNVEPGPIIMSVDFRPAFYAQGKHIPLESHSINELLSEAINKQVDFLIIDERNIKGRPQLRALLNEQQNPQALEMVYRAADQPGYEIVVYRVKLENFPLLSEDPTSGL
jgi:4-amino-4-deoxy-L-arabinose transferase-like glycosyltransferase